MLRAALACLEVVRAPVVAIDLARPVERPARLWWGLCHEVAPTGVLPRVCLAACMVEFRAMAGRVEEAPDRGGAACRLAAAQLCAPGSERGAPAGLRARVSAPTEPVRQ